MTEPVAPEEEPALVHGAIASLSAGQLVVHVDPEGYLALLRALRDDGYQMCVDLCGVDYLTHSGRTLPPGVTPQRFEVVVDLLSFVDRRRIRVRAQVPESDSTLPSLFELYPGTEAQERETYDMFGIVFDGHPDMTRILMPDDWEGHPLRKDYGVGRIPVQFKGSPGPR
jgi:NADH-quinone oxidoreductase subunit C